MTSALYTETGTIRRNDIEYQLYEAVDWLQMHTAEELGVSLETSSKELDIIAINIELEALDAEVIIVDSVLDYLKRYQSNIT